MAFPGSAPSPTAALDFPADEARVVLGVRAPDGAWRVLGVGSAPLEGIEGGRITHVSDAAETIAAALKTAVRSANVSPETLFYTLHDPQFDFKRFRASRPLAGEGQVRPADVRAAFAAAERLAGDFETANVYSTSLGFVIDDQDPIAEPVGIFGRKLEIEAGFLQARSETLSTWREVLRRAYAPPSCAIALPHAAVLGALGPIEPGDRQKRAVVFTRAGEIQVCRTLGLALESCERLKPEGLADFVRAAGVREAVVAGEHAERTAEKLLNETGQAVVIAKPESVAGLHAPQDAPTAGLFAVAREREKMRLTARHGHGLARKVRRKLTAFWNDYF